MPISYIHTVLYEEESYRCCDMHQFTGPADLNTYKTKNHIFLRGVRVALNIIFIYLF